ncbi:hypothetical protein [Leptospirillum ferriphilum]|uniref:hypothetical protein n=1 Tax=Leptospirillum ferriphilum TaxID=178606 RepID=UPI0006B19601|nr:hypothetical protein [Leptospirillum ferriphilum]
MNRFFLRFLSRLNRKPGLSRLLVANVFLCLFLLFPVVVHAADAEKTSPGARPVPDSVLAGMRGGFSWGGVDFSFGIESSTFINGTLMVKTILQTVGNELYASTGVNPFSNGGSSGKAVLSSSGSAGNSSPLPKTGTTSNNLSVVDQTTLDSMGKIQNSTNSSSSETGNYSNVVQIQPSDPGTHAENLVAPTSFSNAAGILSVLQNAASNLVIHNDMTMNATVSNVANITHALSLNSMLQSARFLSR